MSKIVSATDICAIVIINVASISIVTGINTICSATIWIILAWTRYSISKYLSAGNPLEETIPSSSPTIR